MTKEKEEARSTVKELFKLQPVKRGRPTKYKKEYCKDIIAFMSEGATIVEWCVHVGHPKATIESWMKDHADFSCAVQEAKQVAEAWWHKNIRDVLMFLPTSSVNTPLILNQVKSRFASFREGVGEQPAQVKPVVIVEKVKND